MTLFLVNDGVETNLVEADSEIEAKVKAILACSLHARITGRAHTTCLQTVVKVLPYKDS